MEDLRVEAGEAMKEAFPGSLKRYALPLLPASTLSKARLAYVCCPLFRMGLVILALKVGGADKARAQRLVDRLQRLVHRLWPESEAPAPKEIVSKVQEIDAAEDVARTEYLMGVPGAGERWLDLVEQQQALVPQLIDGLEAEARAS